jgi:hypothetical protein
MGNGRTWVSFSPGCSLGPKRTPVDELLSSTSGIEAQGARYGQGDESSFDTHTANNTTKEGSISRVLEENEC